MGRGKKSSERRSGGAVLLDRNLVPRIENFALNNDIRDVDDVADYLRRTYKEYQRKQLAPFRQMCLRAIEVVQRKGVNKPELQLQVLDPPRMVSHFCKSSTMHVRVLGSGCAVPLVSSCICDPF